MNTRPVIGIDANGVLFDHAVKVAALKRITGVAIPPSRFGPKKQVFEEFGISPVDYEKAMKCLFENPKWFHRYHRLVPDSFDLIQGLHNIGFDIVIVSSCRGLTEDLMQDIIRLHRLAIADFIKVDTMRGESKTDLFAQCVAAIEDGVGNLLPLLDYTDTVPILMLPGEGGTGCEVIKTPEGLDPRIRVGRGWAGAYEHIPDINKELLAA